MLSHFDFRNYFVNDLGHWKSQVRYLGVVQFSLIWTKVHMGAAMVTQNAKFSKELNAD